MARRVVLGLGNLLMGDEGIGVHAVRQLDPEQMPTDVDVVDGGTSAFDLLPILASADRVIVVDAVRGGHAPGTLYRVSMDALGESGEPGTSLSLHQVSLQDVVEMAERLGVAPSMTVIGVEPKRIETGMALSAELRDAVPRIHGAIHRELGSFTNAARR